MKIISEVDSNLNEVEVFLRYPSENAEVERIRTALVSLEKRLVGYDESGEKIIPVHSILYVEAVNRKVFVYTEGEIYEVNKRLYEIREELSGNGFVQISKQIIVNLNKVCAINPEIGSRLLLTLDNGERVIVSRQYAPSIKKELGV